jgi:hypothetical protein
VSATLSKAIPIGGGRMINATLNMAQSIHEMIDERISLQRLNNPATLFLYDLPDKIYHYLIGLFGHAISCSITNSLYFGAESSRLKHVLQISLRAPRESSSLPIITRRGSV